MYYAGEFLGFLNERKELHPATIPKADIEKPEEYEKILLRLQQLSSFENSNVFKPQPDFDMFEFYNRTGVQLKEMLLACSYRGKKCKDTHFKVIFTRYGKCYSFNHPSNESLIETTLKGGVDNGLELLLDVQQDEYMPMWKESGKIAILA